MCESVGGEFSTEGREVLEQESSQVTIFTKRQQVLLVQSINVWLGVLLDNSVGDDDRPSLVSSSNPVHGETTGKTGHGTEERLESFRKMMGDVILVDLDHSPPRMVLIGKLRLTTNTDDS